MLTGFISISAIKTKRGMALLQFVQKVDLIIPQFLGRKISVIPFPTPRENQSRQRLKRNRKLAITGSLQGRKRRGAIQGKLENQHVKIIKEIKISEVLLHGQASLDLVAALVPAPENLKETRIKRRNVKNTQSQVLPKKRRINKKRTPRNRSLANRLLFPRP